MGQSPFETLCDFVLEEAWGIALEQYPTTRLFTARDGQVPHTMKAAVQRAMDDGVIDYDQLLAAALSVLPYRTNQSVGSSAKRKPLKKPVRNEIRHIDQRPT